jgi:hypothetical protein
METMRTTTGQPVSISYDARTNTVVFAEGDWFADPVRSSAVPAKGQYLRRAGEGVALKPQAGRTRPRRLVTPAKAVVWLREPAGLGA